MDTLTRSERSARMALIRDRDTRLELTIGKLLRARGWHFNRNVAALPGKPDLVFRGEKKIVFLHGCFWHWHECTKCRMPSSNRAYWLSKLEGNRARDRRTARALRAMGWSVMTAWECQSRDPDRLVARIEKFLKRQAMKARKRRKSSSHT